MRRILAYITAVLATAFLFCACEDETDFSSDSNLHLSYSTDTLKFESLLTQQATSTRTIMVYNSSGEDLKINSVELKSGSNSFQMNVDGRNGTTIKDVELRDGDSLYIFVRANLPENADNQPVLVNDSILINYNGNQDRIILNAVGQNAVVLRNYTVEHDTTWTKDQPFLIFDSLKVAEGAKLTIKAGTKIYLHNGATITVDGSLDIRGNASDMVLLSGDRLEEIATNVSYTDLVGQWGGLHFSGNSTGNIMEGVFMRGATTGIVVDSATIDDSQWRLTIANSIIRTSRNGNLQVNNARVKAYNTVFANGGSQNVYLEGGEYLFNHCTLSENSTSNRYYESLVLIGTENQPIAKSQFNNCIINGSTRNEIDVQGDSLCDYHFSFSLLNRTGVENDSIHYSKCIISKDVKEAGFTFDTKYRYYDFHIDSTSAARKIGDPQLKEHYPECALDLDANPRGTEETDAGAYLYIEGSASEKE